LPAELPFMIGAVVIGAFIGTTANLKLFSRAILLRALGLVLLIAGVPLILGL
jgi:hypothetical protein